MEITNFKMAEMVRFFTKPLLKHAQNQSQKRGSLGAPKPVNNNEWLHSLKKYLDFSFFFS